MSMSERKQSDEVRGIGGKAINPLLLLPSATWGGGGERRQ